ncbi:hypothetical protein KCP76_03700 [Salmonella enterica subsp. enterica serovar Weltevreden]|nr:hypothetical protein KCP76_03700 [Salmonella enterica subsp. enterica serovar Weltevreden]
MKSTRLIVAVQVVMSRAKKLILKAADVTPYCEERAIWRVLIYQNEVRRNVPESRLPHRAQETKRHQLKRLSALD